MIVLMVSHVSENFAHDVVPTSLFENKFDESQYEKTIKNNLSSIISDKLMIRLQN